MGDRTQPTEAPCPHCKGTGKVTIPPWVETVEAYYFGCIGEAGHHWFDKYARIIPRRRHRLGDVDIDSSFCPGEAGDQSRRREVVGEAALRHAAVGYDDWTVLAWWDRSVDSRPGSNSNIVVIGKHDYPTMLAVANAQFARVMKRQKVELKLVESPGD